MNAHPKTTIITRRSFLRSATVVSAAVLLAITSGSASELGNVVTPPSPLLLIAPNVATQAGVFLVHGEGFSQGGSVYLNVSSLDDGAPTESFWTVASTEAFGPNGSQDPARGYVAGGILDEWIELDGATVWGPNGSQDPAQGYRESDRSWCQGAIEIQAFDAETRTWSNRVRTMHTC